MLIMPLTVFKEFHTLNNMMVISIHNSFKITRSIEFSETSTHDQTYFKNQQLGDMGGHMKNSYYI